MGLFKKKEYACSVEHGLLPKISYFSHFLKILMF